MAFLGETASEASLGYLPSQYVRFGLALAKTGLLLTHCDVKGGDLCTHYQVGGTGRGGSRKALQRWSLGLFMGGAVPFVRHWLGLSASHWLFGIACVRTVRLALFRRGWASVDLDSAQWWSSLHVCS